jgi:hypothetical protein
MLSESRLVSGSYPDIWKLPVNGRLSGIYWIRESFRDAHRKQIGGYQAASGKPFSGYPISEG